MLTNAVAFSSDGRLLASAGTDRSLRSRDVQAIAQIRVLKGDTAWVNAVAFSPDGQSRRTYDPAPAARRAAVMDPAVALIDEMGACSPCLSFEQFGGADATVAEGNEEVFGVDDDGASSPTT